VKFEVKPATREDNEDEETLKVRDLGVRGCCCSRCCSRCHCCLSFWSNCCCVCCCCCCWYWYCRIVDSLFWSLPYRGVCALKGDAEEVWTPYAAMMDWRSNVGDALGENGCRVGRGITLQLLVLLTASKRCVGGWCVVW
jgi:hypothetical protein